MQVPTTRLLATALPHVDFADAYALAATGPIRHAQEGADAIFDSPPVWVAALFGVREAFVRVVGIERGGRAYWAVFRWFHPAVVRAMLSRAALALDDGVTD